MNAASSRPAWQAMVSNHAHIGSVSVLKRFATDPERATRRTFGAAGFYLDYSKNRINGETLALLTRPAQGGSLSEHISAMFRSEAINATEHRAALHTAPRSSPDEQLWMSGVDGAREVHAVLVRMVNFSEQMRSGAWCGNTGRRHLLLLASGSEVAMCIAAYKELTRGGVEAQVVSMPFWDVFEAQGAAYREPALPEAVTTRVSVEAAAPRGWDHHCARHGAIIAMHGYGPPAPRAVARMHIRLDFAHMRDAARLLLAQHGRGLAQ